MSRTAADVRMVQTHVSCVFFVGDRAYKLKRPVTFGFLDFSTRGARERACRREVELNARLAPDVYLGVSTVLGVDGAPCDHLVVMRRMPEDRRLATLVTSGADVDGHLRRIARTIAVFHAAAGTSDEITAAGSHEAIAENWAANVREMRPFVGSIVSHGDLERIEHLARDYLAGCERLLALRARTGAIRDGHGDLLADDIFCLDDGPRILDCIEFDDRLRYADVVADIAFLAMDLERLGRPDLSDRLVGHYRRFSGDTFPRSLVDHHIAYRALVRAKVACLRAAQGEPDASAEAVRLLGLAHEHLRRARPVLTVVGGTPGTGKSTLARGLADARGWGLLRSDEVRKDLAGVPHLARAGAPFGADIYSPAMTSATYDEMLIRARHALEMGTSVVLDATWAGRRPRAAARAVASAARADLVQVRCDAPQDVASARLRARGLAGGDPSDATADIAGALRDRFQPWPDARTIVTTGPEDEVLREALAAIEGARADGHTAGLARRMVG